MSDIAIILGMDWLVSHGAQIDCGKNTVALKNPIREKVVYQGDKNARLEATLQLNALRENRIKDIPVVREFQDVFLKELPGMPIDLILGTSPIAQAPYKMGPKQLVELKAQLDGLKEK
jgi:hypothetical protein